MIDNIMTKKQRGTTNNGRKILDRKQQIERNKPHKVRHKIKGSDS